ncbi:MAG: hydroxyectoine utilization dehydratase EutB [Pseudomonadota bacterium]
MPSHASITLQDVFAARARIAGRVRQTPLVASPTLSARVGHPVSLKLECLQVTGSFKIRGATNALLSLTEGERRRGVVGVSAGNHGRGLALAAHRLGVRCIVCMSRLVPQNKIDGIKAHGADVRIVGDSQDEAEGAVDALVADGMTMVPPFDHPAVIAGQGTIGIEVLDDAPDVATVVVPLSGGGLIAGVALAMKAANPSIRVIGVSMERGPAMAESVKAGRPIAVKEMPTLADSLGGGIGLSNRYTFAMTQALVDDIVLVSEKEIAQAIRHAYWQEQVVVEGSGSVGIAALLAGKIGTDGHTIGLVSGRNIDMALHKRLIDGEDVEVSAPSAS